MGNEVPLDTTKGRSVISAYAGLDTDGDAYRSRIRLTSLEPNVSL